MAESVVVGSTAFSTGFSRGFRDPLIPVYINIVTSANEPTIVISISDWDSCSVLPNDYWNKSSDCSTNEKELYSTLQMNMWNNYGVEMEYYVIDYNTSHNVVFGEDGHRYILRTFDAMAFYELPKEEYTWSQFGIDGLDNFIMYINKEHFAYASTVSASVSSTFDSRDPLPGDVIKAKYNGYFYEIINVKQTIDQFLQGQHTWSLTVRPFRDDHLLLSATTLTSSISAHVDTADILEINDYIDELKVDVLYSSASTEEAPNDPFGGW